MRNGTSEPILTFRRMGSADRREAFGLLSTLMLDDEYYRDSSPAYSGSERTREAIEATLGAALSLFVDRPDYGFIFMAYDSDRAVACASVSYAISMSLGDIVAKIEHMVVAPNERRRGIGTALVEALIEHLRVIEIARLDVDVHVANEEAKQFYHALGFEPSREERMALLL
jgi:GNAT superfamily N-acetyltransferase